MRVSERLVRTGSYTASDPAAIIARAYYELLENKTHILGMSLDAVAPREGRRNFLSALCFLVFLLLLVLTAFFLILRIKVMLNDDTSKIIYKKLTYLLVKK